MKKRDVYIPYETKNREFDGKLLLISNLLNVGFSRIFFGSRVEVKKEALLRTNGIFILKSLSRKEDDFYKKLKAKGFLIALLHVEGGIHYKDNKNSILSFFDPKLLKYIDYNFVFGENIKKDIIKYCGKKFDHKIIVSGEPRFDLIKPKFKQFYDNKVFLLKKQFQEGFILINTSFSAGNPVVGKEELTKFFNNEPSYTNDTKKLLLKKINTFGNVVVDYIDAIKKIALIFPNKHIVIRPHPSESIDIYYDNLSDYKNIYITKKGNVHEWILASDCVIHYDCTTGMEALLAGKFVISYLPQFEEDIIAWLPVELSNKCYNTNELINCLANIFNGNYKTNISDSILNDWKNIVHNVEHFSGEIISNSLREVIFETVNRKIDIRQNFNDSFQIVVPLLKMIIKKVINRTDKLSISQQKFGVLSKSETSYKLNKLRKISHYNYKIKLKKPLAKNILIIETKDI